MAAAPPRVDPFRFGWRYRYTPQPNGEVIQEQIPLTPEDLLDPQVGDEVPQTERHFWTLNRLALGLYAHFSSRKDIHIAGDFKLLWGIPGLAGPAPDFAVTFGVRNKEEDRVFFDCVLEETRPSLIVEIVDSTHPELRRNDYERKVEIYERGRIPEYIIIEPPHPVTDHHCLLTGYRLGAGGKYQPIQPDPRGFLLSETTNLLFGVVEDSQTLQVIDAATGERLLTSLDAKKARRAAEERAEAAEAEVARLRAELERARRS